MNNTFDFFDQIYCVHLPHETERLKLLDIEFKKFGINERVQYVHSTPPPKEFMISSMTRAPRGEFGCNMSQIKGVVHAIATGANHPLFLEDDIIFNSKTETRLAGAISELPDDWDILYLGGHPRGPAKQVSTHLAKVSKFSFADSYAINKKSLLKFFDTWTNAISSPPAPYDFILGNFTTQVNSFCVYPIVCEQRPGRSGISNEQEDKKGLITSRWKKWIS